MGNARRVVWMLGLLMLCGATAWGKDTLSLSMVATYQFWPKTPESLQASPRHGDTYTEVNDNGVVEFDYASGTQREVLYPIAKLPEGAKGIDSYEESRDGKWMLIGVHKRRIYRRSAWLKYYLYNRQTGEQRALDTAFLRLAEFSPSGDAVAYFRGNNLYVQTLADGREQAITTDGEVNRVINGAADWVYEEEFNLARGYWWHPQGTHIAFLRFDESKVPEFSFPLYGQDETRLHPKEYRYKYPKAGEPISVVTAHVWNRSKGSVRRVEMDTTEHYLPLLAWSPRGDLAIVRMDRLHRTRDIYYQQPDGGPLRLINQERNSRYLEEPGPDYLTFLGDGRFVIPSERGGFRQILLCQEGKKPVLLTSGKDEIKEIYGYDKARDRILYQRYDGGPLRTQVCAVSVESKKVVSLSSRQGTNSATFSGDCAHFQLYYTSVNEPMRVSVCDANGKEVRVMEDNAALKEDLKRYDLPKREFFRFKGAGGELLHAFRILPPGFDSTKVYPVLMYQYSGPNSQEVLDRWELTMQDYFASRGMVVVVGDPRGTGGRGEEFRKCTYGRLGALEVADQLALARYMGGKKWVDEKRIAIWGWSYGGFMSSLAAMKGNGVLCMGIAVAPVTSWRFYDAIYTERYMGMPATNGKGYDDNSPVGNARTLRIPLYIAHGTADDNVHFQNAALLTNKLLHLGLPVELKAYPDFDHSIYARVDLYNWIMEKLKKHLL